MSNEPLNYDLLIKTWEAATFGHDQPDCIWTTRRAFRRVLILDGWDRNKIRRFFYHYDKDAKLPPHLRKGVKMPFEGGK